MSFTIHNIDKELDTRLSEKTRRSGISKNKLVQDILTHAVGLPTDDVPADDYREFFGLWTASEAKEFETVQAENRGINEGDWK
jgi:hypothetical protein